MTGTQRPRATGGREEWWRGRLGGGNVTGLSLQATNLAGKRLELLREVVPQLRRLAIMFNVGNAQPVLEMGETSMIDCRRWQVNWWRVKLL